MSTQPSLASLPLPITPPASPPSTDSNHIEDVIAGAFSGTVSRMITAPLDVLKIRSQLHFGAEAPSMLTSLRTIVKEEGISALWKGNLSATYLWITYGMAQFLLYGIFKSWGENQLNQMDLGSSTRNSAFLKTLTLFAAGATAGMGATAITYPLDIMRTQFAVQGKIRTYRNIQSFIKTTFNSRGVKGFYAGLSTAVVGIGPYMGFNFAIYDGLKRLTNEHSSHISLKDKQSALGQVLNVMKNGLCGALAGGTSKLLVYPLDTVKRRMQIQVLKNTLVTAAATPTYSSAWNCLSNTLKSEGIQGLYKGLGPTIVKSVIASAISFAAYEGAKDFLIWRKSIGRAHSAPLRGGMYAEPNTPVRKIF